MAAKWLIAMCAFHAVHSNGFPSNSSYHITPVPNAGLLFEPVAIAHLYTDECVLYASIAIPSFDADLAWVTGHLPDMRTMCTQLKTSGTATNCAAQLAQTADLLATVVEVYNKFAAGKPFGTDVAPRSRRKRSQNFVEWLFDIPDEQEIQLQLLTGRTREMQRQIARQESIIESVYTRSAELVRQAALKDHAYEAQFQRMHDHLSGNAARLTAAEIRLQLIEADRIVSAVLVRMQTRLRDLTDIVASIGAAALHPLIMTAAELRRHYTACARSLHNAMMPAVSDADFAPLMRTMQLRSRQVADSIYVRITLPVPERTAFDVFKIYAIPSAATNALQSAIRTDYDYLAASGDRSEFVLMSDRELNACRTMDGARRLCRETEPRRAGLDSGVCEVMLFQGDPTMAAGCKRVVRPSARLIVPMVMDNKWLFVGDG